MTWPMVALGEVAEFNPRLPKTVPDDDPVSFLPMAGVSEEGAISYSEGRRVADVRKGYTHFRRGDVLLAKITPCFENGKATRTADLTTEIGAGSTEFHVVRASDKLDPSYAFHMLWNDRFRADAAGKMTGSAGQRRVPVDVVKSRAIPLPPLPEQRRIAGILDAADALRRRRREAIETLDTLQGALFAEMFGNLSAGRSDVSEVPFTEACMDRTSRSSKVMARDYEDAGQLPVIDQGAGDIAGYVDNIDLANTSPLPVVIFGDHTRNVKLIDFPFATGADGAKVLVPAQGFRAHFLAAALRALPIPDLGYSRHMRVLKRMRVPKPSLIEQNKFVTRIDGLRVAKMKMTTHLAQLDALFSALQSRAFAGEL